MKNLLVFASVLLVSGIVMVSCSKDEILTKNEGKVSEKGYSIKDGIIVFNTLEDFKKILNYLNSSTPEEIKKWEESIDFTSMFKYYELASDDLCCGENANDFESLKAKYEGKIRFEKNDIQPLLVLGTVGRLVNTEGFFKIGKSIVKYTEDKAISIPDGDLDKLQTAINTLQHDADNGIYIHDLFKSDKTNCAGVQTQKKYDNSGDYYLESKLSLINVSFVTSDPYVGTFYNVVYELKTNIKHKKKRLIGWGCERRNITWSNGYEIIHDLANFNTPSWAIQNPSPVAGGTGWTSASECDFNWTYTVIFESVDPTAYYGHSINIDRLGQQASVFGPSISTNTYCD